MFIVFLRVLIIYLVVLIFLRLMGKRQIGEMQPYEVVITLIIADLATVPMSDTNIPLLNGILPLAILVLIHYLITLLTRRSIKIRRLLSGTPIIVINPEGVDYKSIKNLNMSIDDLYEMLRQNGYTSFDHILYAIIETNGKMSVVPNPKYSPLTVGDMNIEVSPTKLPNIIINDGKVMKDKLKAIKLDNKKFNKLLSFLNIKSIKDVLLFSIDENGKIYYQEKNKKYKIINNIYEEINL